jgi:RimJ/RimL family protein N-acetyltransferase
MKFAPIQVTLKNGIEITLREVLISDAARMIEYVQGFVYESEFVPLVEGEFNPTLEEEEKILQSYIIRENALFLVAEYDGNIVGNINIDGQSRKILQHTAVFGMGMWKQWQNIGLGTVILTEAIQWAKRNPILEMLWLQVYAENEAGLALYRKMGFIEHGITPNFFKQNDRYYDEILMHLKVI